VGQGGAVLLGLGRVQEAAGLIELMFANQDLGGQDDVAASRDIDAPWPTGRALPFSG
jgi:hypothetical protein